MSKFKNFFSSPKKSAVTIICAVALLAVLGTVTVFAASSIAESSAIGSDNAKNFAYADAGIDPLSASNVKVEFDFEQGQFVYEVEFAAGNSEYEYWIKAADGTVVKKQVEIVTPDGSSAVATAEITMDKAKEIALADAGLSYAEVKFTKEKLDIEDGFSVYELDFVADRVEYEYEINAITGDIYSKSKETFITAETAKPAQPSTEESRPAQAPAESDIGVEAAKSIALSHAGTTDVTFTKAKRETEDGVLVYEIEFRKDGTEYEYTVRAADGTILEYDSEIDD